MDILTNKKYGEFDYICRYVETPFYYNTVDKRDVPGITSNINKDISWVAHKVKPTDTLDSLALNYYNNPTFWWAIAYFNNIQDPFIHLATKFDIIKIPSISQIEFGDFR